MKPTAKNHTTVGRKTDLGRKTDPWRYALVLVMEKPIPFGLVINFEKSHTDQTAHTLLHGTFSKHIENPKGKPKIH